LVLWTVLATTPLSTGAAGALDLIAGLLWSGVGVYIVTVGFRRDDEVVSTLGIASLALGATQLLNLAGDPSPATEILGLGAVALAVACAYLDVAGLVSGQRSELDATREAMRDLAHEARSAITAIEGTIYGLDSRSDLAPDERDALKAALRIELQSLRLMLTRDRAEPVGPMRLASVLHPIVTAAGLSDGALRWKAPDDLEVQFAGGALTEIVQALIDNARTHSGTLRIGVEVDTVDDRAEIRVIDHGRGVSYSMRRNLFERGTKRPGSPGRGLGLNIARRLARSHGGDMVYLDNPGGGARFVLSVPLARRVVDLALYEDEQPVEIVDDDTAAPQGASPYGHRRDPGLPRESHRHRGPQPGGEVAGV
jgi:signal transduction histidine kinase